MASCKRTVHGYGAGDALHAASERAQRPSAAPSRDATEQRFQLTSYLLFTFAVQKALHRAQGRKRSPPQAHRDVPRPRMPRRAHYKALRCALHTSTRVQSTLVTHAPCVRASPAMHMLSCGNVLDVQMLERLLESLATGCPSAGSPLAHLARMRFANTLATSAAREAHASSTRCACHPPPTLLSPPYAET